MNFDRLDLCLSSALIPTACLRLVPLDGLVHGIVCSPVQAPVSEWLEVALSADPERMPFWGGRVRHRTLCRDHGRASQHSCTDHPSLRPGHVDKRQSVANWCDGFLAAVSLRYEAWRGLIETASASQLFGPIARHVGEIRSLASVRSSFCGAKETNEADVVAICRCVVGIHEFWRGTTPRQG